MTKKGSVKLFFMNIFSLLTDKPNVTIFQVLLEYFHTIHYHLSVFSNIIRNVINKKIIKNIFTIFVNLLIHQFLVEFLRLADSLINTFNKNK